MRGWERWPVLALLCLSLILGACGEAALTATPMGDAAATPLATAPTPSSARLAAPTVASPSAATAPVQGVIELPPVTEGIVGTINAPVTTTGSKQTWVTDLTFADALHGWMVMRDINTTATIFATTDGGKAWAEQLKGQGITDIEAASATHIWAVQDSTIIFSTDAGKHWQTLQSDIVKDRIGQVEFSDESNGWATGRLIYRTLDSGRTWERIATPNPCNERQGGSQFSFVSPLVGWMLCSFGGAGGSTPKIVFKTEDGAQTWALLTETTRERSTPNGLSIVSGSLAFFFINEREGWYSGQYGTVKTSDGGLTWHPIPLGVVPPGAGGRWVRFVTSQHGYAVVYGSFTILLETTDGGEHWTPLYNSAPWPSGIIRFTGRSTGIAAGTPLDGGAVLRTDDGGESWRQIGRLGSPTGKILQFSFVDANNGWAYSYDGGNQQQAPACFLHRTADGGATWRQLPAPRSPALACDEYGVSVDFVDRQTGFLAHTRAGGSSLLITHDGGENFQSVGVFPFTLKQLTFSDGITGWAISGEGIGIGTVVATEDGGHSWHSLPRNFRIPWTPSVYQGVQNGVPVNPILPNYGADMPNLFPGGVAWLLVSVLDPMRGVNLLLRTDDGGRSWTRYFLEVTNPADGKQYGEGAFYGAPQFVDLEHGWLIGSGELYRTTDGGRTWVQLRAL